MLQWGRTREGAEGAKAPGRPAPHLESFSGAAPVKVRKGVLLDQVAKHVTSSFSGAAPVKVRKGASRSVQPADVAKASVGPHP